MQSNYKGNFNGITRYLYSTIKPEYKNKITRLQNCGNIYNRNGKQTPYFCNSILCQTCQNKKAIKNRKKYTDRLNPDYTHYFITISPKSIEPEKLHYHLYQIKESLKQNRNFLQKYFIGGVISLELTYTKQSGTYKPHFHGILETETELTQAEIKHFLNEFSIRFMKSYNGKTNEILQTETENMNTFGNKETVITTKELNPENENSLEKLSIDFQKVEKGTESKVIGYCIKATDLLQTPEQIINTIESIKENTRFINDFGTLRNGNRLINNTNKVYKPELKGTKDMKELLQKFIKEIESLTLSETELYLKQIKTIYIKTNQKIKSGNTRTTKETFLNDWKIDPKLWQILTEYEIITIRNPEKNDHYFINWEKHLDKNIKYGYFCIETLRESLIIQENRLKQSQKIYIPNFFDFGKKII